MSTPCDLERIGDCLWQCKRCGRRVHTVRRGDGSVVEPQPDRMPPCGWKPLAVEVGGHFWLEQPPDGSRERRFRCQRCTIPELRVAVDLTSEQIHQILADQAPCPNARLPRSQPTTERPPATVEPPGLLRQAANYAKAVGHWLAEGRPVRPPAEIERILAICKACEHYADGRCRVCGCRVNADEAAWRNKIAMATQRCPQGKWGPYEPKQSPAAQAQTQDGALKPLQPSDLKTFVDRVYVINLRRRPDRLKTFLDRLHRYGWPFREPIVYPAIEGDVVGVPPEYQSGGGAYGCRMSHLRILQDCLMEGVQTVMILEDDAEIAEDFTERAAEFLSKVPADWEGVMLGGQHHAPPIPTEIPGVVRVRYAQRTHAYIARRSYMRALQQRWGNCTVHIDWAMKDWQHQRIVYAPDPWLIGQAGGRSDIRGAVKPTEWWTQQTPRKAAASPHEPKPIFVVRASRPVAEELQRRGWHMGYWRDGATGYDNGLIGIAKLSDPAARRQKLQEWGRTLWSEAEPAGCVVALWHPDITVEEVRAAWSGPVIEVQANTAEEAEAQIPSPWREFLENYLPPNQPPIVLLDAPESVREELSKEGWLCVEPPSEVLAQDYDLDHPANQAAIWLRAQVRTAYQRGQVLALCGPTAEKLPIPDGWPVQRIQAQNTEEVFQQYFS